MIKKIVNFFYFWHPKIALRYLPIVDEIKKSYKKGDSILEVGSGSIGIAPYINEQVIGVDQDFSGKAHPLLKQVKIDATNLPFADKSFDFVVSSDVLEHIPPNLREKAIGEWLRVARKELILAFPEGEKSEIHDKELFENFKKNGLSDYSEKFFKEHLEYGLPRIDAVKMWIHNYLLRHPEGAKATEGSDAHVILRQSSLIAEGSSLDIRVIDNLNLFLRKFLMSGWMTKNVFIDLFFRKILLFFIPILRLFNNQPTYRKIIFVKLK